MENYPQLKLENQLCFPLYVAAKEVVNRYRPLLSRLDLTYTQYIVMMVLWEEKCVNVKHLGERLYLDSGTLTPLLKGLETKGYLCRRRSNEDERCLSVSITAEGEELRKRAASIPAQMAACVALSQEEAQQLYRLLYKIIQTV